MSPGKTKSEPRSAAGHDPHAYYVYCIAETQALDVLFEADLPQGIEPDSSLELVKGQRLAAVVSKVPLEDYSQDAFEAGLEDATWTAIRAMRHEKVVEHFSRKAGVVPLRFGAIYLEIDSIEQMLDDKQAELLQIIERISGRDEWGVNIFSDRAQLLDNIVSLSPNLRELNESAKDAKPGQAYLFKKKIEALRTTEARAQRARVAESIEQDLSPKSDGCSRLRVLKDEGSEQGDVTAKFAFLVRRERFDDFRAAAEEIAAKYADAGFRLELTGPWPAYNFAGS